MERQRNPSLRLPGGNNKPGVDNSTPVQVILFFNNTPIRFPWKISNFPYKFTILQNN